jgi:hypothetical protein
MLVNKAGRDGQFWSTIQGFKVASVAGRTSILFNK